MNTFKSFALLTSLIPAISCTNTKDSALSLMDDAGTTYADIVLASYTDSVSSANDLHDAINAFLTNPSESTLDNVRQVWKDSREPYLQTEVYRFYDGPIDHEAVTDNEVDGPEGLLNAWPLDESWIDYTVDNDSSGIVNDTSIEITAANLLDLNEDGGEENVATGYHAVEFLLWGQDFSESGPGARPYTDFVTDGTGTASNQDRRSEYLTVASELMIVHLSDLKTAWMDTEDSYRTDFLAESSEEQLRRILTGMIILSGFETGGERLQAALDSGDQEDEHSCFSDNTHRDMIQDIQGVANVYNGTYGSVSGVSIQDVVAELDSELAERLNTEIQDSLQAAQSLQTPFDNEIAIDNTEGRERVQTLITALRTQEKTMEEVFRAFELDVPVAE
jgi:putative iron-regulated protein